ncbi:MAG: Gfo/Idh/MocA family oxidoreductase [Spirochaetia bacterium]
MDEHISLAVIGAGNRGNLFADIVSRVPQWARVVAVAEPRKEYREAFAGRYGVAKENACGDWRELAARPRFCDAVVVSTLDREHVEPAVAFTSLGYHMLLEKPMATTLEDCRRIARAQEKAGTITCVCHSLRYNKGFAELKRVVQSGEIGRVVTIDQLEQVIWWHQAHSFVRGNWGNEGRSTFMLLSKSCHDIDFIAHLVEGECQRVQSFGSLAYFTLENAPVGSGELCTACAAEPGCPYSAVKLYVDADREAWPAAVIAAKHSRDAHLAAIRNGPYGRCVWKCDNDVVDHQVVSMEFDAGVTATFTMTGFTQSGGRRIRVHGTKGEVEFTEEKMLIRTFADSAVKEVVFDQEEGDHGGGDARVMVSFLAAIREKDPSLVLTDVHESLRTHSIVFAAEKSRRQGRMVEMEEMET